MCAVEKCGELNVCKYDAQRWFGAYYMLFIVDGAVSTDVIAD